MKGVHFAADGKFMVGRDDAANVRRDIVLIITKGTGSLASRIAHAKYQATRAGELEYFNWALKRLQFPNLPGVTECPHFAAETTRIWWNGGEKNADWQVRVGVNLELGMLTIQSGPSGDRDGTWNEANQGSVVVHTVSGYDVKGLVEFAQWVQDTFVGDPSIVPAVEHLIACQQKGN